MADEKVFDFSRHNDAAVRIYLQHWMSKLQTGFLLHPKIQETQKPDVKVIDVACGTGIWLVDLASQLPSTAQLDGCDVSPAHFPLQNELPKNVKLSVLDMFKDFPEELKGRYDIVHVARIYMWIRDNDPTPVLRNLLQLLKPGGYLQWDDLDVGGIYIYKPDPSLKSSSCQKWLDLTTGFFREKALNSEWLDRLPEHFEASGVTSIDSKRIKMQPGYAKPWSSMQLMAHHDLVEHDFIPGTIGDPQLPSPEEWRTLVEEVDHEVGQGVRLLMDFTYAIGQKR